MILDEDNNRDNKEVESIVEDTEKFLVRIKELISGIQKKGDA